MIGPQFLAALTLTYPALAALCIAAAGIYAADAIDRRDPARWLAAATFAIFAARWALLAVTLPGKFQIIDRYAAQEIAVILDSAGALCAFPYLLIVLYRRCRRRRAGKGTP